MTDKKVMTEDEIAQRIAELLVQDNLERILEERKAS